MPIITTAPHGTIRLRAPRLEADLQVTVQSRDLVRLNTTAKDLDAYSAKVNGVQYEIEAWMSRLPSGEWVLGRGAIIPSYQALTLRRQRRSTGITSPTI